MPIRFRQGDIALLLQKLGMMRLRKGSRMYGGIGPDGIFRLCKFDYHSDSTPVATGTADAIAKSLGLGNTQKMKDYLDTRGWKRK